jgi:hypothetical protein
MRCQPFTRFVPVLLVLGALAVTVSAHAAPQPDRDPPRRSHKLILLDDEFTPEQVEDRLKEQHVPADIRDQVKKIHDQHRGITPDTPPADTSGIQAIYYFPFSCQMGQDAWVMYRVGYGYVGDNWTYRGGDGYLHDSYYRSFQGNPAGGTAYSEFPTFPYETITRHYFTTPSGGYYTGGSCI